MLHHQLDVVLVRDAVIICAVRNVGVLVLEVVHERVIRVRVLGVARTRRRRDQPGDHHRHEIHVSILLRPRHLTISLRRVAHAQLHTVSMI